MLSLLTIIFFIFSNAKNLNFSSKNVGGKSQKVQDKNKIDISSFLFKNAKYIFWFVILVISALLIFKYFFKEEKVDKKKAIEKLFTTKSTDAKKQSISELKVLLTEKESNGIVFEFLDTNIEISDVEKIKKQINAYLENLLSYYEKFESDEKAITFFEQIFNEFIYDEKTRKITSFLEKLTHLIKNKGGMLASVIPFYILKEKTKESLILKIIEINNQ